MTVEEVVKQQPAPAIVRQPEPTPRRPALPPDAKAPPGKGGAQHKYLQALIKRWAESRGWKASIEKAILDGRGSVDVALEREGVSIAVEVSITTGPEQELGNVRKCLAAGFRNVVVVFVDSKALHRTRALVRSSLSEEEMLRVAFLMEGDVPTFFEEREAEAAGAKRRVKGYDVTVEFATLPDAEKKARKRSLSQIFRDAWRRLKQD